MQWTEEYIHDVRIVKEYAELNRDIIMSTCDTYTDRSCIRMYRRTQPASEQEKGNGTPETQDSGASGKT